jgi:hypothetical protein
MPFRIAERHFFRTSPTHQSKVISGQPRNDVDREDESSRKKTGAEAPVSDSVLT